MAGVIRQQQIYSSLYRVHLEWLQCFSEAPSSPIHLTFYPIAKNLRLIGTALHDGVRAGRKVHIAPGNPREAALLRATGRGQWNPWLWSRIPRGQLDNLSAAQDDSARAWPTFFVAPDAPVSPPFGARPARPAWRQPGGRRTRRILETGACISYAFRLNPHMQAVVADHASRIGWRDGEPKLAIHLRRGDAASEDLQKQTRASWSLEDYLVEADRLCERYGLSTIYLSTESQSEIEKAKTLRPQYRFLSLDHDRSVFPRLADTASDMEVVALKDPSIVEPIVNSAIADLYFLGRCDAFLGAFNSEFSVLGWLICIGEKGYIMPYKDLVPRMKLHYYQARLDFRSDWVISQFYDDC
jgi:hypothetical protein